MAIEEARTLWLLASGAGGAFLVVAAIAWFLVKFYLPAYLGEKGKNLATKEDVARITHLVEEVKDGYEALREERKAHTQLRMAAIDERLKAHQEAYDLWSQLYSNLYADQPNFLRAVIACQEWWPKRCLYLEPAARDEFLAASSFAMSARSYRDREAMRHPTPDQQMLQKAELMEKRLLAVGDAILMAVSLPPLTSAQAHRLQDRLGADPP